jgi:hypothetical protein
MTALVSGCASRPQTNTADSGPAPAESFVKKWSVDAGYKTIQSFHKSGDMLYVYGPNSQVAAIDLSGGLQFRTRVGGAGDVVGAPMTQAERIIFPTSSSLEIVSRKGNKQRTIRLEQPMRSPGVAAEETVFAGSDSDQGGRLAAIALDRPYDIYRWTRLLGLIRSQPVLYENSLYVATEDGKIYAMTTDPVLLWPATAEKPGGVFKTDGSVMAPIKVDEGGVYVASTDTKLYVLDPVNGNIRWQYYAGVPLRNGPQPGADTVYLTVPGQGLVALDKKVAGPPVRQPRWTNRNAKTVVAEDAQIVYVLTTNGAIAALDKKDGRQRFITKRSDFTHVVPNINPKDNTIYAVTADQKVMAFQPILRPGSAGELVMAPVNEVPAGG